MSDEKYRLVEEDYDNVELSFHNAYDAPQEFPEQIASFLRNLSANDSLLNIGDSLAECSYFLNNDLKVTDVDISQPMINYITERAPRVKANIKELNGGKYNGI